MGRKKISFWAMLLLDAYSVICIIGLLLLLSDFRVPVLGLMHK